MTTIPYPPNSDAASATPDASGWGESLRWGIGAALLHRLLLTLWMAASWSVMSGFVGRDQVDFHNTADLPALETPLEQNVFGVLRRWDAIHYLDLAMNGYRPDNPGPTVFGVLTPLALRAADWLLPDGLDLASIVVQTAAFVLALTLLHRLCAVYYGDPALGRWAVAVMALLPLSYFFAAPMSETLYLALTLGVFYFGARGRWPLAALYGLLATLARTQGAALVGVAALLLAEQLWRERDKFASWRAAALEGLRRGWTLALIPLGAVIFATFRAVNNLPSLEWVYTTISYRFYVNPIEGILINVRILLEMGVRAFTAPDTLSMIVVPLLAFGMFVVKRHRRLPLLAYTFGYLLVFVTPINWAWGTDIVVGTQSFARYTLVLFPVWVLVADGLRALPYWGRIVGVFVLLIMLLALSGLSTVALTGP